jgi:hypothetical protein
VTRSDRIRFKKAAKRVVDNRRLYPAFKISQMVAQDVAAGALGRRYRAHVVISDGNALLSATGRAANYLRASGAPRDYRGALYAYNHSQSYVEAVLRYAERMKRDLRAFYSYYSWQVFVRTPSGLRRLTGPGVR